MATSQVIVDNSSVWFSTIQAVQLANWCDAAAVAVVCYDSVLMFPREVQYIWRKSWSTMSTFYVIARYLGIALSLGFWAFNANISMPPSTCVTLDRFVNFGGFVSEIVGNAIMCIRLYAMYLGSKWVLYLLILIMLGRIGLGLAVAVVIFGPHSGIGAIEWILSGVHVCGPIIKTSGTLPLAWDIMQIIVNSILFLLAVGRFIKHAFEMRRISKTWTVNELMRVLVKDSIIYFSLNLLATILLMVSVWGAPNNTVYFAIVSAYTQNEASVLIPRLVISFRENYAEEEHRREGVHIAKRTLQSFKMEFKKRLTDDFEMQTVHEAEAEQSYSGSPPEVEEVHRRLT